MSITVNVNFLSKIVAQYSWVPRVLVQKFVNACNVCTTRRRLLTPSTIRPIIALEFMTRLQVIIYKHSFKIISHQKIKSGLFYDRLI